MKEIIKIDENTLIERENVIVDVKYDIGGLKQRKLRIEEGVIEMQKELEKINSLLEHAELLGLKDRQDSAIMPVENQKE